MSLINDALKKAKQAQTKAPARESAPQLRSPDSDHPVRTGRSLVGLAILIVVGLVGATLTWFKLGSPNSTPARTAELVANAAPRVSVSPPIEADVPSATASPERVPPATAPAAEPKPPEPVAAPGIAPPAAGAATPAPASPRLNGIFFNPARPTAIVNNKLVAVGSRVGDFTVLAITQSGITLAGGGQTNVLSLSE